jgi:hypothetical protein
MPVEGATSSPGLPLSFGITAFQSLPLGTTLLAHGSWDFLLFSRRRPFSFAGHGVGDGAHVTNDSFDFHEAGDVI